MIAPSDEAGPLGALALAAYSVWFYPAKTLWPLNLNAYYMRPIPLDWTEPRFLLSMAAVVAVSGILVWMHRRFPGAFAAWLAYLVLLAPNSGLVVAGKQLAADRYSYFASLAWVVPVAWVLYRAGGLHGDRRGPWLWADSSWGWRW